MRCAREAVLARGGAARANVFTRITLALFDQVPWQATPWMRPEAMLLPKWAPFHVSKVSYWSRTVIVPLFVLATLKPRACNSRGIGIRELFLVPPEQESRYLRNPTGRMLGKLFLILDHIGRISDPLFPSLSQRLAIARSMAFIKERLNGKDGLGGILPAMAYGLMAFLAFGYPRDLRQSQRLEFSLPPRGLRENYVISKALAVTDGYYDLRPRAPIPLYLAVFSVEWELRHFNTHFNFPMFSEAYAIPERVPFRTRDW